MQYTRDSIDCQCCGQMLKDKYDSGYKYCSNECRMKVVTKVRRGWKRESKLRRKRG